jgi:hypothetical protein
MRWIVIAIAILIAFAAFGCAGATQTTTTTAQLGAVTTVFQSSTTTSLVVTTTSTLATTELEKTFMTDFYQTVVEFMALLSNQPTPAECYSRVNAMISRWDGKSAPTARTQDVLGRWLFYAGQWNAVFQKAAAGDALSAKVLLDSIDNDAAPRKLGSDMSAIMLDLGMSVPDPRAAISTTSTTQQPTTTLEPTTTTEAVDTWNDGTYLVGTDIPAGLYKSTAEGGSGYWQLSSDPNGDDIIANDNTEGQFYVKLTKGQYLELSGVEIQLASTVPAVKPATADIGAGVYLVGTDIAAGRYKGTPDGMGYWEITSDANGDNILSNDLPEGQFYVQVKKGQYLKLSDVTISLVK